MNETEGKIRIAAMADIHVEKEPEEISYREIFKRANTEADVLAICGDLTTLGKIDQVEFLSEQLSVCTIPVVVVLGNHDHEGDEEEKIIQTLRDNKITVLDGESHVIKGIGFAGTKGFGGGFRGHTLGPFGERVIKDFVTEAENEKHKLEKGLQALDTPKRVVLLHYSPIRDTIEGEPPEIFPFLGNSIFEDAIDNFPVSAVLHGHAHYGSPEGKTRNGVPVYNVAMPVLKKNGLDYKIIEI